MKIVHMKLRKAVIKKKNVLTDNHSFADYYSINFLCLINNSLEDNISKTVFEVTG